MADKTIPQVPDDLTGIYAQAQRDSGQYYAHLTQGLIERIGVREQELLMVDEALARRPAVAEAPNRYIAICSAFEMASRAQKAEAMEKHWKFHYDKQLDDNATLRAQLLESSRITDEALAQRDEALKTVEQLLPQRNKWAMVCSRFGYSEKESCAATIIDRILSTEAQLERQQRAVTDEELLLLLTNCRNGLELLLASHKPERPDDPWDTINELRETVRKSTEAIASRSPAPSQDEKESEQ